MSIHTGAYDNTRPPDYRILSEARLTDTSTRNVVQFNRIGKHHKVTGQDTLFTVIEYPGLVISPTIIQNK